MTTGRSNGRGATTAGTSKWGYQRRDQGFDSKEQQEKPHQSSRSLYCCCCVEERTQFCHRSIVFSAFLNLPLNTCSRFWGAQRKRQTPTELGTRRQSSPTSWSLWERFPRIHGQWNRIDQSTFSANPSTADQR